MTLRYSAEREAEITDAAIASFEEFKKNNKGPWYFYLCDHVDTTGWSGALWRAVTKNLEERMWAYTLFAPFDWDTVESHQRIVQKIIAIIRESDDRDEYSFSYSWQQFPDGARWLVHISPPEIAPLLIIAGWSLKIPIDATV